MTAENIHEVVSFAQEFSKKTGAVIAITGAIDLVCNENIAYAIYNGHEMSLRLQEQVVNYSTYGFVCFRKS